MNWNKTKTIIQEKLSLILRQHDFIQSTASLEWVRYINDVCQIVRCEKMSGDHIRLFAFTLTNDLKSIGGHLERYTIQGSINYPGQNYWSILESDFETSLSNMKTTIEEVAIPWFSTIATGEIVYKVLHDYEKLSQYTFNEKYFNTKINKVNIENDIKFWGKLDLEEMFNKYLVPNMNLNGFVKSKCDFVYIRKRNEVYDVIEVLPINFGIHLACFAYNWLENFSDEDNKEFSDDARVMFNGGQIDARGSFDENPKIYGANNLSLFLSSINTICNILEETTIPKLEAIKDKNDFILSVDKMHEYSLKAYGLI